MDIEKQHNIMSNEDFIFVVKIFSLEFVIGKRKKEKDQPIIDLNLNKDFFSDLFDKFKKWINSFFEENKED